MGYPIWKYHPVKGGVIVRSEAHEKELGPGWFDSPAFFPAIEQLSPEPVEEPAAPEESEAGDEAPKKRRGRKPKHAEVES